jgi:hypothetical protein
MTAEPVNLPDPLASFTAIWPTGTPTTGDRHEGDIPDHVESTTGHEL